jgi:beta-alanine degradation protein BauB
MKIPTDHRCIGSSDAQANAPTAAGDDERTLRRALLALLPALALPREALAVDATQAQPSAYRVAFENDHLRVLEYRSRPGLGVCGVGMHSHPAHLTVALSPGKARVKLPDGKTFAASNQLGDVFWSEAETHEVENVSGKDMRALIVELKPAPTRKG